MRKILLAVDATNPDRHAAEFACYLARMTKSKVTGVFLENVAADQVPVLKDASEVPHLDWQLDRTSEESLQKRETIEKNISLFKQKCTGEESVYRVHRDRGVPAKELIEESRFADLIVIDPETSFNKRFEGYPTEFVKDVLKKAECPVIIAPESFDAINEIVFTYNHTASCVFAIKQFTYLFPQLRDTKVTIVQASETGQWHDRDKYHFSEWLKEHYNHIQFEGLKGEADTVLFDYLFKKTSVFVVMGAYGRNSLSQFFTHSKADLLLRTITAPIFITHQ